MIVINKMEPMRPISTMIKLWLLLRMPTNLNQKYNIEIINRIINISANMSM